ncbi:MAG: rhodanese-like domain-containing protein [Bacteroidota bacterium]
MRKITILFLASLSLALLISCQNRQQESKGTGIYQTILKEEFAKKLEEKTDKIILDVRKPDEYRRGTIDGAININYYDQNFDKAIAKLDKSKPVFIFCNAGGRSAKTLNKMKALDFKEVYDLRGGYSKWKNN